MFEVVPAPPVTPNTKPSAEPNNMSATTTTISASSTTMLLSDVVVGAPVSIDESDTITATSANKKIIAARPLETNTSNTDESNSHKRKHGEMHEESPESNEESGEESSHTPDKSSLNIPKEEINNDPVEGFHREVRITGTTENPRSDIYYHTSDGKKLRSRPDVDRYAEWYSKENDGKVVTKL